MAIFFKNKTKKNISNKKIKTHVNDYRIKNSIQIKTRPSSGYSKYFFDNEFDRFNQFAIFKAIRNSIPIVDAAFEKIKRLIGGFEFKCDDKNNENFLNDFCSKIKVGASLRGISNFIYSYLDNLLMFGNSIGEIIFDDEFNVVALYNADINNIILSQRNDLEVDICLKNPDGSPGKPIHPKKILFTALNPPPGKIKGRSIMQSLPLVSEILMKIYNAIGENFERIGNIRFAITYNPKDNAIDQAYANERAQLIAQQWAAGMEASRHGQICDFITTGDVKIKAIGDDNKMIECQTPVRLILEQIIAALSVPPFMLGISWSTTERMSKEQSKLFTKELEYYRRLLEPVLLKTGETVLQSKGLYDNIKINWDFLNLIDQMNAAKTRLYNAQAEKIELENQRNRQQL